MPAEDLSPKLLLQQLKKDLRTGSWKESIPEAVSVMKKLLKHVDETRAAALRCFVESGEKPEHFDFRDSFQKEVSTLEKAFAEAQLSYAHSQRTEARQRSAKKEDVLSEIRKELSSELITNTAWQRIEALKKKWEALPEPPTEYYKKHQAAYAALLRQAYERQHIVRALRNLDKEKNTAKKAALLERLGALQAATTDTATYLKALSLEKQYKKIGPALPEKEEGLFSQFTSTCEAIKASCQSAQKEEKKRSNEILEARGKILEELEQCLIYKTLETSVAWKSRNEKVQELREKWQALPSSLFISTAQEDYSQKFWQKIKTFYKAKKKSLATAVKTQQEHLKIRKALIKEVEELLRADKLDVEAFFELQKQWKVAGTVPRKEQKSIHQTWKELQTRFFERKDELQQSLEQEKQSQYALYKPFDKALSVLTKSKTISLEMFASALNECPKNSLPERWTQRCSLQIATILQHFFNQKEPPFEELKQHLESFKKSSDLGSSSKLLDKKKKLEQSCRKLQRNTELLKINIQRLHFKKNRENPIQQQLSGNISQQEVQIQQLKQLTQLYKILLSTKESKVSSKN